MNFSRLKFYDMGDGVQAKIFFENNFGASIVQGSTSSAIGGTGGQRRYGDPEEDTYEVAVLVALKPHPKTDEDSKITYSTPITDDVLGHLTREEVENTLDEIAALPPRRLNEPARPYAGDFTDEEAVLEEIASEIDVDLERATIREDRGLTDFGSGTVYYLELGNRSWMVVENEDQEHELALALVRQDLEEGPENFNQNFIEGQIDEKKLKDALWSDVLDMRIEDLEDMK